MTPKRKQEPGMKVFVKAQIAYLLDNQESEGNQEDLVWIMWESTREKELVHWNLVTPVDTPRGSRKRKMTNRYSPPSSFMVSNGEIPSGFQETLMPGSSPMISEALAPSLGSMRSPTEGNNFEPAPPEGSNFEPAPLLVASSSVASSSVAATFASKATPRNKRTIIHIDSSDSECDSENEDDERMDDVDPQPDFCASMPDKCRSLDHDLFASDDEDGYSIIDLCSDDEMEVDSPNVTNEWGAGSETWDQANAFQSANGNETCPILQEEHGPDDRVKDCTLSYPDVVPPKKSGKRGAASKRTVVNAKDIYIRRAVSEQFYLRYRWGDRLEIEEVKLTDQIKKKKIFPGNRKGTLVCVKTEKVKPPNGKPGMQTVLLRCFYVATEGPGLEPINIKEELEKIADFQSLPINKAISRMELFVSPAARNKQKEPYQFYLNAEDCSMIEIIEDRNNEGCGFISPEFLAELLGDGQSGVGAVQMRFFSPQFGIFKGMLVSKPGIAGIQLPDSMCKVKKSRRIDPDAEPEGYLLFNNVFPSHSSVMMERSINPKLRKPPKTAINDLKGVNSSVGCVLEDWKVDPEVLEQYNRESQSWTRANHNWCVGVADPTNSLPPGTVFVTGLGVGPVGKDRHVFVTRSPCTEKKDGVLLPLVSEKPPGMDQRDWKHLCGMRHGILIFANRKKDSNDPIPPDIAGGDLDGDLYFVCWDMELISHLLQKQLDLEDDNGYVMVQNEEESQDELIGKSFTLDPGDGKKKKKEGIVKEKVGDDCYLVDFGGENQKTFSRAELYAGRECVEQIVAHKLSGKKNADVAVQIKWSSGVVTWQKLTKQLKQEIHDTLADYATQKKLLGKPGWTWMQISDVKVTKILRHRKGAEGVEVEVLWEDGSTDWELLKEMKTDENDKSRLTDYARENDLFGEPDWSWANQEQSERWFHNMKNVMSDSERYREHELLRTRLHGIFKKLRRNGANDWIYYGRAYKESNDVLKHGGLVTLAYKYRKQLKGPNLHKYLRDDGDTGMI